MNYTGYETLNIIREIEKLESRIDMSLPTRERAKHIYDLIASEYSYMYDYENYPHGHKIAASLRAITNYNETGKKGLVCAGYASLYKELCLRCGIACEYITGYAGERHAWNVVIDGDEIIPVDVTWKVGTGKEWFGVSHEFQKEHEAFEGEVFKS
jgi:transglutaminase/protease-like cytokinesis protein 3